MADAELVTDPAAIAFETLGSEVKLLRLTMQAFIAEKEQASATDYSPTLAEIVAHLDKHKEYFRRLADRPAIQQTAQDIAEQIIAQGKIMRGEEMRALDRARATLTEASSAIIARVNSAWDRDRQKKWGLGIAAGIALTFTFIGANVPSVADRMVPTDWRWPELRAASQLNMGLSEAGLRLISVDDSEHGARLRWSHRIIGDNIETLKQCETKATKAKAATQCILRVPLPARSSQPR